MILSGTDGIDHLNIYSKAATPLGRWLSNFAYSPIDLPEHGQFASVEAYWYWLSCKDDALRSLHGWRAKSEGMKRDRTIQHDNFEALIKTAIDIKLKSNYPLMMELAQSDLPLCHYYEYGGKRVDAGYEWITQHIVLRRTMLKDWLKSKYSGDAP